MYSCSTFMRFDVSQLNGCGSCSWHLNAEQLLWLKAASVGGDGLASLSAPELWQRPLCSTGVAGEQQAASRPVDCSRRRSGAWRGAVWGGGQGSVWRGELFTLKLTSVCLHFFPHLHVVKSNQCCLPWISASIFSVNFFFFFSSHPDRSHWYST